MAVGRRRRRFAAEVSLLSRTSTTALLFLGLTVYGIGDTAGRHVPVEPVNSSTSDPLNLTLTCNTSIATDAAVSQLTPTHTHGDTTSLHKMTDPVTALTHSDHLSPRLPHKVTVARHLFPSDGNNRGVSTPTYQLSGKQYLELITERLHNTEVQEDTTVDVATTSTKHSDYMRQLNRKTSDQTVTTTMSTRTTTVKVVSSAVTRGRSVTTSRKYLSRTVPRSTVQSHVAVTTAAPPPPTGYEDYFMPVDQADWESYNEEDNDDEPETNNDTEDKIKTGDNKANSIQESDIFSMREDGFGPISDIRASQIEVKGPLLSHSFLAENSMGLLVIYTWVVMVTVIAIVTMVVVKHKQQLVDALWERRLKTARTRRVDDTYEEEHNLLPYPQV